MIHNKCDQSMNIASIWHARQVGAYCLQDKRYIEIEVLGDELVEEVYCGACGEQLTEREAAAFFAQLESKE